MTEDEIQRILRGKPDRTSRFTFRLGDTVRIKSGPYQNFTGTIDGINQAKALLKIRIDIFGRKTPLKLRFLDVEKVFS